MKKVQNLPQLVLTDREIQLFDCFYKPFGIYYLSPLQDKPCHINSLRSLKKQEWQAFVLSARDGMEDVEKPWLLCEPQKFNGKSLFLPIVYEKM